MPDGYRPLAVVTGASSGIGLALAHELADRDHDLVLAAEDAELDDAAAEVRAKGATVVPVRVDLATAEGVGELAARVRDDGRAVDVLCLNAGVGVNGAFVDTELAAHLNLIALNVTGAVHLAGLLVPEMASRRQGRVLFTSSIAASMPGAYQSTYNASKSFLLSFAEAIRTELADSGVTVTALMPGPTDTEFFERADMEDTKLAQTKRDDPTDVAAAAIDALMAGKDHVITGLRNKVQAATAKVLPDRAASAAHAKMAEPGSGD
jgi:short-subunit dehydrogenase